MMGVVPRTRAVSVSKMHLLGNIIEEDSMQAIKKCLE